MAAPVEMASKAKVILQSTPGTVSDNILRLHGIGSPEISHARRIYGLNIERVRGLGYRLVTKK